MQHTSGFIKLVSDAKFKIQQCTVDDIYTMQQNHSLDGILIDTRERSEVIKGYILNAIHMSKGVIESFIESTVPDKSQKMYFYCGGGFRSALVANSLQEMGYKSVVSVDGGWRAWNARGYPIILPNQGKSNRFLKLVNIAKVQIKECSAKNLYEGFKTDQFDGMIFDVREELEFNRFHIQGATHLSKGQIEVKIESLVANKNQKIYLYSNTGSRAALSACSLQNMGYANVFSISGGIQSWLSKNYPIIQD